VCRLDLKHPPTAVGGINRYRFTLTDFLELPPVFNCSVHLTQNDAIHDLEGYVVDLLLTAVSRSTASLHYTSKKPLATNGSWWNHREALPRP